MTRARLLPMMFATVCAAVFALAGGPRTVAAPVPKDAGKNDPAPDLKAVFAIVEKAVEAKKWPKEDDEKILTGSARVMYDRALRAAELKPAELRARKLPVEFKELKRRDPVKEIKRADIDDCFVIATDVRELSARDAVIFASGKVDLIGATNCVIFAKSVNCVAVENCLVVAGEDLAATSVWRPFDTDGSVLVAGKWIRTALLDRTICHVLRPGKEPAPGEAADLGPDGTAGHTAIRTGVAKGAIFLNAKDDVEAPEAKDCKFVPQPTPIAK